MLLLSFAIFRINFSKDSLRNTISMSNGLEFWIQIRMDVLMVLIWVKTVCKGYQQTIKVTASKERVNMIDHETVLLLRSYEQICCEYL